MPTSPLVGKLRKPTVQDRYIRMIIYGPNRSGKSVLAGSAAELLTTLYLENSEGGSDSLVRFGYQPDVLRIKEVTDLNEVFWGLKTGTLVSQEGTPFQLVVMDDVGELQKRAMDVVMGVNPSETTRNFLGKMNWPQRKEWGITTEQMRKVIRYFNDLPVHLLWTAQDRKFMDPATGSVVQIGPDLSPALSSDVCNSSKIIGYLVAKAGKEDGEVRRILVVSTAEINGIPVVAGQRMGLKEEVQYFLNPTFRDIYEAVLIERGEEESSTVSIRTKKRPLKARGEEQADA